MATMFPMHGRLVGGGCEGRGRLFGTRCRADSRPRASTGRNRMDQSVANLKKGIASVPFDLSAFAEA